MVSKDKEVAKVLDHLNKQGYTEVIVRYTGYGDSGGIDTIELVPASHEDKFIHELAQKKPTLDRGDYGFDVLCNTVYSMLPGGWEINEGSAGTVHFDTGTHETVMNHEWGEEDW